MTQDEEIMYRTYAWSYFSFHGDQRMKTFNFFLIVAGLLTGGIVTLVRESGSPWVATPMGLLLTILCWLFWRIDERNRALIKNGEAALKYLDTLHHEANESGVPHVLRIVERDDFQCKGKSRSLFQRGHFSFAQAIRCVYGLFGALGLFLAIVPLFIVKPVPPPLPVQIQGLPELKLAPHSPTVVVPAPAQSAKLPTASPTP